LKSRYFSINMSALGYKAIVKAWKIHAITKLLLGMGSREEIGDKIGKMFPKKKLCIKNCIF